MDLEKIIKALADHDVDYVIVGGVAAVLYGSTYSTNDLDLCYSRDGSNLKALVSALAPFQPRLRGKNLPNNLPFHFDPETLKHGLNFTLTTTAGDVDLIGEIKGVGQFKDLVKNAQKIKVFGVICHVISLDDLIQAKKAAGRGKDLIMVKELEAIAELQRKK